MGRGEGFCYVGEALRWGSDGSVGSMRVIRRNGATWILNGAQRRKPGYGWHAKTHPQKDPESLSEGESLSGTRDVEVRARYVIKHPDQGDSPSASCKSGGSTLGTSSCTRLPQQAGINKSLNGPCSLSTSPGTDNSKFTIGRDVHPSHHQSCRHFLPIRHSAICFVCYSRHLLDPLPSERVPRFGAAAPRVFVPFCYAK